MNKDHVTRHEIEFTQANSDHATNLSSVELTWLISGSSSKEARTLRKLDSLSSVIVIFELHDRLTEYIIRPVTVSMYLQIGINTD
jgi:hypothetical protein